MTISVTFPDQTIPDIILSVILATSHNCRMNDTFIHLKIFIMFLQHVSCYGRLTKKPSPCPHGVECLLGKTNTKYINS